MIQVRGIDTMVEVGAINPTEHAITYIQIIILSIF